MDLNSRKMLPEDFVTRMDSLYKDKANDILGCFAKPRVTTFRINTLKTDPDTAYEFLTKQGYELGKISWYPDAFILKNRGLRDLEETELYQSGSIYVQGLSSMIPSLVLDPKPNDQVLDITAAPGSKTTQMSAMMNNIGLILANDASKVRIYKLKANLKRQGVNNVVVKHGLGQKIWREFPRVFDKALVDVPCSMEGRFRLDREKTYKDWSTKKIKKLVGRQRLLLWSAVSSVRPGGTVVYSTCTLSPEENEGVVNWLLKKEKGKIEVENIDFNSSEPGFFSDAIKEWKNKTFHDQISLTKRILPTDELEGFYIAKLRVL